MMYCHVMCVCVQFHIAFKDVEITQQKDFIMWSLCASLQLEKFGHSFLHQQERNQFPNVLTEYPVSQTSPAPCDSQIMVAALKEGPRRKAAFSAAIWRATANCDRPLLGEQR